MKHGRRILFLLTAFVVAATVPGQTQTQERKQWNQDPPLLSSLTAVAFQTYFPGVEASPRTAQALNSRGFDVYKEDRLIEAARLFKASFMMDPNNPYAHYNYAAVLSIFAQGFDKFDAAPQEFYSQPRQRVDLMVSYRSEIFDHLKTSISLQKERLQRVAQDPDFDTIRGFQEYNYVLLGQNPSIESVVAHSPRWYSIQPGAFLPNDTLILNQDFRVEFSYDMSRYDVFPELGDPVDHSFSGCYRLDGNRLVIFRDGISRILYGTISLKKDELGFVTKKVLQLQGFGPFSDKESHYWEGQDG